MDPEAATEHANSITDNNIAANTTAQISQAHTNSSIHPQDKIVQQMSEITIIANTSNITSKQNQDQEANLNTNTEEQDIEEDLAEVASNKLRNNLMNDQKRCIICLEDWPIINAIDQIQTAKSSSEAGEEVKQEESKLMECQKDDSQSPVIPLTQFENIWKQKSIQKHESNEKKKQKNAAGEAQTEECVIIHRLVPCNHYECNTCFTNYHQKNGKMICPVCQLQIQKYTIINIQTMTESEAFSTDQIQRDSESNPVEQHQEENLFESFDHQYFDQEVANLISLRQAVEFERFKSRRTNTVQDTDARNLEWQTLKQIEQRLLDIQEEIWQMVRFDSTQRMTEIHEINEILIKIQAGRIETAGLQIEESYDYDGDFGARLPDGDLPQDDDEDYDLINSDKIQVRVNYSLKAKHDKKISEKKAARLNQSKQGQTQNEIYYILPETGQEERITQIKNMEGGKKKNRRKKGKGGQVIVAQLNGENHE